MRRDLMPQSIDPPVQLLESSLTVFLRERVDDVVDLGRAPGQRIDQAKPRRQTVPRIGGQQLSGSSDLVFQLPYGHHVGALAKSADEGRFERERVEGVAESLDDVRAKQLVVGQF